jgi:tetratricopeptide (TPR) repeat protein
MRSAVSLVFSVLLCLPGPARSQVGGRAEAERLKRAGDEQLNAGKKEEAERSYQQACGADPGWYVPLEALGNLQFRDKRYAEAVATFQKAVAADPRYHTGLYNIAFAHRKAGEYRQAVEAYLKYIEKQPQDPDPYYGLASSYEALGDRAGAIQYFEKYAQVETRPSEKQYVIKARTRATELQAELDRERPAPVAEKPVAEKPSPVEGPPAVVERPAPPPTDSPPPAGSAAPGRPVASPGGSDRCRELLAVGDRSMAEGSYTLALKAYFDAVQLEPENTEAIYKLGLVYQRTGNQKAARFKWEAVLRLDPQHAGARQALAALEQPDVKPVAEKPAPPPATEQPVAEQPAPPPATEQPVAEKPAPPPAALAARPGAANPERLAEVIRKGDQAFKEKAYSQAIAAYTQATQLAPAHEEALFKLGVAYAMSGNYKVALFKWEQVLKLNPNNESARRNIEKARSKAADGVTSDSARTPERALPAKDAALAGFDAWLAKAHEAKRRGEPQAVFEALEQALKLKPDAGALVLQGEALVILKRPAEAKRVFSNAMVLDPNLAAPLYGLGEVCRQTGDLARARYYFGLYVKSQAPDVSPELLQRAKAFLGS